MIHITDHAMLRYIERAMGIDVAKIRDALARRIDPVAASGASRVTIGNATFCIVENSTGTRSVTTALEAQMRRRCHNHHRRTRDPG